MYEHFYMNSKHITGYDSHAQFHFVSQLSDGTAQKVNHEIFI